MVLSCIFAIPLRSILWESAAEKPPFIAMRYLQFAGERNVKFSIWFSDEY
jgi:hypothetical protein